MATTKSWFEVDKEGLAKLVADRGKVFILHELFQNAWDAPGVTKVHMTLVPVEGSPRVNLMIQDDSSDGWKDLTHAHTLFAESEKKGDPTRRGMFNLGEKLVLALCEEAEITTMTGGVRFDSQGRANIRRRTDHGSIFSATIRMTRAEYDEVCRAIQNIIPPPEIATTFNGREIIPSPTVRSFTAKLPTVIAGEDGIPRRVERETTVRLKSVKAGEIATLYEMGIPVVEIGDTFHVDVQQKVPLNMQRDNVPPSYLRTLRVAVVNNTPDLMTPERAASTEVQEATSDDRVNADVVDRMLTERFGIKRFIYDPSDTEANKRLVSNGYTPIMGGSLNAQQWQNVRVHNLSLPAGVLSPSPKPYSEGGDPEKLIPESAWTEWMRRQVTWIKKYAAALGLGNIQVKIAREPTVFWHANYGSGTLTLNLGKLGHKWFDSFPSNMAEVIDLMIHEFGHHYSPDHLSEDYYHALTRLGAKSTTLALDCPALFRDA